MMASGKHMFHQLNTAMVTSIILGLSLVASCISYKIPAIIPIKDRIAIVRMILSIVYGFKLLYNKS